MIKKKKELWDVKIFPSENVLNDPNYYIENQLLPAVSRILTSIGYSEEEIMHKGKQSSLDAFFS